MPDSRVAENVLNGKPWSKEETQFLKDFVQTLSFAQIAEKLNRSTNSIRSKAVRLGLHETNPNRFWTKEEELFLELNYSEKSAKQIAKKLNRSVMAIRRKAESLRLGFYQDDVNMTSLADAFNCDKSVIAGWIKKYNMPCKKIKRGKNHYYRVDIKKFWKWAKDHKKQVLFDRYQWGALTPEPEWLYPVINTCKRPQNHRKPFTTGDVEKIKARLESGMSCKDIATMYGRSVTSIKHVRKKINALKNRKVQFTV